MTRSPESENQAPGLKAIIQGVLAALFGVQTDANRRRDFTYGQRNPLPYIVVFIVLLLLFVLGVAGLVKLVLTLAG